jgi:hypothetical protein
VGSWRVQVGEGGLLFHQAFDTIKARHRQRRR